MAFALGIYRSHGLPDSENFGFTVLEHQIDTQGNPIEEGNILIERTGDATDWSKFEDYYYKLAGFAEGVAYTLRIDKIEKRGIVKPIESQE